MTEPDDCEYCRQIGDANDHAVVAENDYALCRAESFFREGHCSVILKRHASSISELTAEECAGVFTLARSVAKALEQKYGSEKTYLLSIGDQVDHFHVHLIPKHPDKCSMGIYCFGALFEAEGKRHPSREEQVLLKADLVRILESESKKKPT